MDPAQMADEAVRRLIALHAPGTSSESNSASVMSEPNSAAPEPLLELFDQLGTLDSWAKIAEARLAADPHDTLAAADLCRCLDHTARLHPHFIRRLDAVLHQRQSPKAAHALPQQPSVGAVSAR